MKKFKQREHHQNEIPTRKNPYEKKPVTDPNTETGRDNPINPQKDEPRKLLV